MKAINRLWQYLVMPLALAAMSGIGSAAELNPAAVIYPKFDPANTTAMPAGSFVTHFGKQVHWDGAKHEDTVLLIMGEGPATSTDAEEK